MPKIIVDKAFKFAHHGHQVEAFEPSDEPRDTTDECAEVALAEGWAHLPGAPENAATPAAPENRDATAATPRARKNG